LDAAQRYQLRWNGGEARVLSGDELIHNGFEVGPLGEP
jgi:hypothetical protein